MASQSQSFSQTFGGVGAGGDASRGGGVGMSNYEEEKAKCVEFLLNFTSNLDDPALEPKYARMLQEVANRERTSIPIALDDIQIFEKDDPTFVSRIVRNARRYVALFSDAVDENLPAPTRDISDSQDVLDVLRISRAQEVAQQRQSDDGESQTVNPATIFPPALMRRFEVHLIPGVKLKAVPIRDVKAAKVGALVRIKGMVTRVSTVKPLLTVATYTCEACAYEVYQEVKARQFNPLTQCPSERCETNKAQGRLIMQTKASKFDKYQEVKFQELPDQVPMGHIPRSLTVYLRGELTRTCEPGALVTICGVFLPLPYSPQRQMQMGLVTETYLEATDVVNHKKRYSAMESSEAMESAVLRLQEGAENVYEVLSQSLAPEIYGHEDVKKALLLLLIGGVTKRMDEGMKLRGDLNVLLMGDPGVAKSQLLKHIATVAPRGVYTTGKGSSGVGLTAAVVRDATTKEMTLEGGALVLADMGICCIDEFDKMEEGDRTAIHEVMEQQTVSIAKAGITTTLNARTSVLAAANPIYGRYNKKLSASQNINLPNALLSRFDLLFLLLDVANYEKDEALARHVTYVHRFSRNPEMKFDPVRPEVLRYFIAIAKQYQPSIPEHLCGYIVEAYVTLRQQDVNDHARERQRQQFRQQFGDGGANDAQTAMTARQLLSILRLSQALARLRFSTEVIHQDVDEAIRLVYVSKASLSEQDDVNGVGNNGKTGASGTGRSADATSKIFRLVQEFATDRNLKILAMSDLEPVVLRKGFTSQQLYACIQTYQDLEIVQLSNNGTSLTLI
ncbi:DNA replication licensing factor MCM7 [Phytophthora infestans T30-4]|uniref:DNA replication licensing factor MCM7 n=2 Tax=Phytophthora infestans TaxID=4787 RepID=D0NHI6_PHYIT|nr:DNA replication licensing factor MCM7 [Phytophthora infestans T30-4]EEY58911.1 DNA replication licensing factor MCM7 [Phytophthora infestans T30-4]KAF4038350.1 MCM AAA-lid domain [Phytophthora infestans]KAF4142515.1 MCM AAA-lid domain [Phytophthora infestans]|eukprot:XP_002901384.1 DNA replication licensing factor MCM7 [Phytophthora infestans T30-4]